MSVWNRELRALKELIQPVRHLLYQNNACNIQASADFLIKFYENKSLAAGRTLGIYILERAEAQLNEIFKLEAVDRRDLRAIISEFVTKTVLENDLEIQSAPVIPIRTILQLAEDMWTTILSRKGSTFKARAAATAMSICAVTGNRWIDTLRLRWEDLKLFNRSGAIYAEFRLRIIKTCRNNTQPIYTTFRSVKSGRHCPVKRLIAWWHFSGRPAHGFVFPDTGNSHFDSSNLFYFVKSAAKRSGMDPLPAKHTFRNTLVMTMFDLDFSLDEIRRQFHWATDSEMPIRYLRNRLDQRNTGFAAKLSKTL